MFGLSFTHMLIVAVLALIFIGPKQLPEVARMLARMLNEWKRTTRDFTSTFTDTADDFRHRLDNYSIHTPEPPPAPASTETSEVPAEPKPSTDGKDPA